MPAVADLPHRTAGVNADAGAPNSVPQQSEEIAATDAEPDTRTRAVGISEPKDRPLPSRPTIDSSDGRGTGGQGIGEPELGEDALTERLKQDAGADGTEIRRPLDHADVVTVTGQQERAREPRGPGPDDRDSHPVDR